MADIPRKLINLAKDYERERRVEAAARKQKERLHQQLATEMVEREIDSFRFTYVGRLKEAVIEPTEKKQVSAEKLWSQVETEDFVRVATFSQKAVEENWGELALQSVIEIVAGEEKLQIRDVKT